MSSDQSKATSYSGRGSSLPAFPQFETVFRWGTARLDKDVGAIISSTIGRSLSWFNFLNGSLGTEMPDSFSKIALIPGVCGDVQSATTNCSDLCSRPSDMFDSWRTMWHCLALASLSIADTSFPGLNESSHELIHTALRNFSITSAADFPGEIVLNNTFECAMASCNANEGECKMKHLNASYILDGRVQLNVLNESMMALCEGVEVEMDADIAGPGVVISYIFQAAMAVYVWAFISLPKGIPHLAAPSMIPPPGWERRFFRFSSWPPILQKLWTNLVHATSTFLVEFHEAQCFLVASIEIALLYAKSRPLTSESANWENLSQFRTLVQLVGSTGAWSVILTQTSLRRARLNSFYTLMLSTVSLALVTATVAKTTDPTADEAWILFKRLNSISQCGGNTSLRSFCAHAQRFYVPLLPTTAIYVCVASIITTWLSVLVTAMTKMAWVDQMHQRLAPSQRHKYTQATHFAAFLDRLAFLVFDILIIVSLMISLLGLGFLQERVGADEWGVGQVIAVLVWAPVLSKYLYLIIFGVEKGFFYRLSRAFMVVKRPSETENDDEGDTALGDEGNIASSSEGDITLGDATGADTIPLMPVHRNTAAW